MGSSRTRAFAVALTLVSLLVAGATLAVLARRESESPPKTRILAAPAPFSARIDVGGVPEAIGTGFGSVWVAVPDRRLLFRIDSRTYRTRAAIPFEGTDPCGEIVADDESVWVGDCRSDSIAVIDPAADEVVADVQGQGIAGPASNGRGMWVWSNIEGKITLYEEPSADWERKFQLWNNLTVPDAAVGFGAVWVLDVSDRKRLSPIDERTGGFPDIKVGAGPTDVSVGAGAVWVASEEEGLVLRFDPRRRRFTARIDVGAPGDEIDLAAGPHTVWVRSGDSLARIDPDSNTVVERLDVPGDPAGIALEGEALWIGSRDGSVWRLDHP